MTLVGLAAKNLLRNKVRTALTVLGVAVAILTFVFLRTVSYAWTAAADYAAKDRVVTRHKITFVMSLPKRYIDDVRGAEGVKVATYANWFGGRDPNRDQEFFSTIAVDTSSYFDVMTEMQVPPDQMEAWRADRSGAIVGDVLAKKFGWNIGDKVTLESGIYAAPDPDQPWTFTIRGIYTATAKSVDRSTFHFHWDYLNERLPPGRQNEIGWMISRVTDPSRTADISMAIDRVFDTKDIQTLSQDERAFATSFLAGISAVLSAVDVVSVVILVIMLLILGNTIAMGVRERTNEYGVLRAIGFLPNHITTFIVGEATLIGALGGALGLAVAFPVIEKGLGRWLEENMGSFFPYFRINPTDAVVAMVLALCLGVLGAVIPALGASRLRVTDALRRIA
jgi:putative ABC transport system permease protein